MKPAQAQTILDKVLGQILGLKNPLSLAQFMQKYAFDIRMPQQVYDSTTNQPTWTQAVNPTKFITMDNAAQRTDWDLRPKRPINSLEDILAAWNEINYTTTERLIDCVNIGESDNIYGSENVFRSLDIRECKNILFSDGLFNCEYIVAGQRSNSSAFCARIEDSRECSNSFSVIWSKKIVNSLFIQDCGDLYECMFCCHTSNKKFCIANMQFEETEYRQIKDQVVRWILTS